MKKVLAAMLAMVMVLSCFALTACGDKGGAEGAAGVDLSANITRTDNSETGESTVESDVFSVTLPNGASWDYEVVSPEEIEFYNIAARDAEFGGRLFSIKAVDTDDQTLEAMPGALLGEKNGKNIIAVFTSDVQYDISDEASTKEYMEVFQLVQTISDDASASPLVLK